MTTITVTTLLLLCVLIHCNHGKEDSSKNPDSSAQKDPSGKTDSSGKSKSSEQTDSSGQKGSSDKTDSSGGSDSSGQTDSSGKSKSSGKKDSSEQTDSSGTSDSSGQTDSSGKSDSSGEKDSAGQTGSSGKTDSSQQSEPSGQKDLVALANQWAPKVYMNTQEQFWPGDVEAFLQNVSPQGDGCPADGGLPTGPDSIPCFLTTQGNPDDLLNDQTSFLYGTQPTSTAPVPVYAKVRTCGDSILISYWLFFPFNKGKNMCNFVSWFHLNCGYKAEVGDHVGDWEHLSVELQGGQPKSMFLSVHQSGIYYNYDKDSNTFEMASELQNGLLKIPNPPQTVQLEDGHPVLFSALGTHGLWGAPGSFSYSTVSLSVLQDVTDQGLEWDTWQAIQVFSSPDTTPAWWDYEGRWGNKGEECIFSFCAFQSGPVGLSTRPQDYPC